MLGGLADRPLRLAQYARVSARTLGQRPAERFDEEGVRVGVERERARLARAAHDAARGAAEAGDVLARPAAGARGQLRREPGAEQELQPEGQLVGRRGVA